MESTVLPERHVLPDRTGELPRHVLPLARTPWYNLQAPKDTAPKDAPR